MKSSEGSRPFCRQLSRRSRAWWCADLVHMGYSAAVFLSATLYVLKHPRALLITWSPTSEEAGMLPDVLVSVSAGFFGFQLWALVCTRCANISSWQFGVMTLKHNMRYRQCTLAGFHTWQCLGSCASMPCEGGGLSVQDILQF